MKSWSILALEISMALTGVAMIAILVLVAFE